MPGSGYASYVVATSGVRDIALSADQTRLYVSKAGAIEVYDLATHTLIATWTVGTSLGALSVSEDGAWLLAVDRSSLGGNAPFYRINTATGAATTFSLPSSGLIDVEVINGTSAIVTGLNGAATRFDIVSGNFTPISIVGGSLLTGSGRYTLTSDYGLSPGTYGLYDAATGSSVAAPFNTSGGVTWGVAAVSAAAQRTALFSYYNSIVITNLTFQVITTINANGPIIGIRFSADGQLLYYYEVDSGRLVTRETTGWTVVETITIAASGWTNNPNTADEFAVTSDGSYYAVRDSSTGRLTIVDLTVRNETFAGGVGADSFAGGFGNDIYFINNPGDTVAELANQGIDTVYTTISWGPASGNSIDRIFADPASGTSAINLTGNEIANSLYGNAGDNLLSGGGGNDVLIGYAGNDTLDGGTGNDVMAGGPGDDIYFVDNLSDDVGENAGEGNDTIYASISYGIGTGISVERLFADPASGTSAINLAGNELANSIYGNAGANFLRGFAGNDVLIAYAGNDTLDGGTGNDTMVGGLGDDIYFVESVSDDVVENPGEGTDTIYASLSYGLGGGASIERLLADPAAGAVTINLSGNERDNAVYGNAAANFLRGFAGNDVLIGYAGDDTLDGGTGNDSMAGGTGDDIYFVDSTGDEVVEYAGEGTDTIYAALSYTLGTGMSIERLFADPGFGVEPINLTGNEIANTIYGNAGGNRLNGGAGNDTLFGNGGDDILDGGTGNDVMQGGAGDDTYYVDSAGDSFLDDVQGGYDTVYSSVSYTISANTNIERLAVTDRFSTSAINLTVGQGDIIRIDGNNGDNVLTAPFSNTTITLNGYDGNDTLIASYTSGGTLAGGLGNDLYRTDGGAAIVESAGEGTDTVEATNSTFVLPLGQSIEILRPWSAIAGSAVNFTGNEVANSIFGGSNNDVLNGGGGDDTLNGGAGNDTLTGGSGADIFAFTTALASTGIDTIADFVAGIDKISLAASIFGGPTGSLPASAFVVGTQATTADQRVIYNSETGALFYDADGNGAGAAVQIATLTGAPPLTPADFIIA